MTPQLPTVNREECTLFFKDYLWHIHGYQDMDMSWVTYEHARSVWLRTCLRNRWDGRTCLQHKFARFMHVMDEAEKGNTRRASILEKSNRIKKRSTGSTYIYYRRSEVSPSP